MARAIIIHGTKGSPEGNWFPWLKQELGKQGYSALVPTLPTPHGQSLAAWFNAFERQIGPLERSDVLIGHSLGAIFILRLLEKVQLPIDCAILVAGFLAEIGIEEYDLLNRSFVMEPFNWAQIRAGAKRIISVCGSNDPYVPMQQSLELARQLQIQPTWIDQGGHLNLEFGYDSFPLLVELLKDGQK